MSDIGDPSRNGEQEVHYSTRAIAVLVAVALLSVSCVTATPRVDALADNLERDLGIDLERGFGAKAGRLSLGLVRTIARASTDADEEPEALAGIQASRGIKRVEVRNFEHDGSLYDRESEGRRATGERNFQDRMAERGWTTVAKMAGDDELAWVMVRFDEQRIRGAVVLGLDAEELNVIRLSGRLDRVLTEALRFARNETQEEDWEDSDWEDSDWEDDEDDAGRD